MAAEVAASTVESMATAVALQAGCDTQVGEKKVLDEEADGAGGEDEEAEDEEAGRGGNMMAEGGEMSSRRSSMENSRSLRVRAVLPLVSALT